MTLVVAYKNGDDFNIVADMRLTDVNTGKALPFRETVLKAVVIDPKTCVAFSGDAQLAGAAYQEIFTKKLRQEELLNYLCIMSDHGKNLHRDEVDFLVATYGPPSSLFLVRNGEIEERQTAHIGNAAAFSLFQGYRLGAIPLEPGLDHLSFWLCRVPEQGIVPSKGLSAPNLLTTMSLVIESGRFRDVGGFPTLVSTQHGEFAYGTYHRLSSSESRSPRRGLRARDGHGSTASGNFSQSFQPGHHGGEGLVPISVPVTYVTQGRMGAVYLPDDAGLYKCVLYREIDQESFGRKILESHGVVSILDPDF